MGKEDQPGGGPAPIVTDAQVVTMEPPPPAPPAGEPPAPQPAARRKVKLAGKEIEVDAETADAIEAREQEFSSKLSEQGAELGMLRRQVASPGTPPATPPTPTPKKDLSKLMFEDPAAFITELKADVREEMTAEYRQDQNTKMFWSGFNKKYPDLEHANNLSRSLMANHYEALQDLTVDKAYEKLADLTKQEITRLSRASGGSPRTTVEGPSGQRPPAPPAAPPDGQRRVSDVIRNRQQARRDAQHNVGKK